MWKKPTSRVQGYQPEMPQVSTERTFRHQVQDEEDQRASRKKFLPRVNRRRRNRRDLDQQYQEPFIPKKDGASNNKRKIDFDVNRYGS